MPSHDKSDYHNIWFHHWLSDRTCFDLIVMKAQYFHIISERVAANACKEISELAMDGKALVTISKYDKERMRSLAQNRLMWMWHTELSKHTGDIKEDVHRRFKWQFCRPILLRDDKTGRMKDLFDAIVFDKGGNVAKALADMIHTPMMYTWQVAEALTEYDRYQGSKGFAFTHPEDLYYEAMT